ncbi:MAG: acylphosphatase [Vulcanimicrobiaceae bacterium]
MLEVNGRVQGVGFRYTVMKIAARFEVAGTVRNLPSGAVEIDAEGDDAELSRFISAVLENPPRSAHLDKVNEREAEPRYVSGFEVSQ